MDPVEFCGATGSGVVVCLLHAATRKSKVSIGTGSFIFAGFVPLSYSFPKYLRVNRPLIARTASATPVSGYPAPHPSGLGLHGINRLELSNSKGFIFFLRL